MSNLLAPNVIMSLFCDDSDEDHHVRVTITETEDGFFYLHVHTIDDADGSESAFQVRLGKLEARCFSAVLYEATVNRHLWIGRNKEAA